MRNFQNLQLWTGALIASLMIFIVVFAFVARRPLCIDSKLVERIDSISDQGTATAYRCGLHKHVDYDPVLASQTKELGRRLQKMERYFEWLGPLRKRVGLTIVAGVGSHFRLQGHEIFISESILKSQGQLEKAFLRIWFRERASLEVQSQASIEESLTDFLYYTLAGDLHIQDPKTGLYLSQDMEAKWPRVLSNLKGYCQSVWSRVDDLKLCENFESFAGDEIPPQTLRPLISQALIESYKNLDGKEQIELINGFANRLSSLNFHEKDFGMSSQNVPEQSYHEAISHLIGWSYFLSAMKSEIPAAQKLSALFDISLKRRGFDASSPQPNLDVVIFTEGLSETQKEDLQKQVEGLDDLLIGMESKNSIQMSFLSEPMNLKMMGPVQANTGVLFHCGALDSYRMMKLAKRIQKLLYVNTCDQQKVKLTGFFKKGITSFALQNPTLKFAQLHLPSLMLALPKIPGQNPIYLIGANKKDSLKALGWREPSYDKSIKAYRAQSVIEIVDWYRL